MNRVKMNLADCTFFNLPTRQRERARDQAYRVFMATRGRPWAAMPRDGEVRLYTQDLDGHLSEGLLDILVPVRAVEGLQQ